MPKAPDQIVDILAAAAVKRAYGIVGDYLNGLTEAIRHAHNEEAGAFTAGAEAYLAGEPAACAGSCSPGIDLARTNLRH